MSEYKFSVIGAFMFLLFTLVASIFSVKELADIYFIGFLVFANVSLVQTIIDTQRGRNKK